MAVQKFGPYRTEKVLGRGGMGTVYAGVEDATGRRVALKVLLATYAEDDHFRGRFAAEIETLKCLKHPNIVEIFGYGQQDGNLFYSMELVDGTSLFDELKSGRRFTWREVLRLGLDVCLALRHAHDRGVIHRDLKPGNLLLDPRGRVKLTDFGIAKLYDGDHLTKEGGMIGTVDYMSPEQAQGKPVTVRSDLYSLGSVLYALLARRPPFLSNSVPETIKSLTYEKPPPIHAVAPDTPRELAVVVDRLLEKDPENRIGTAQSLANRLRSMLSEIPEEEFSVEPPAPVKGDQTVVERRPDPDKTVIRRTNLLDETTDLSSRPQDASSDADRTLVPATYADRASRPPAKVVAEPADSPSASSSNEYKSVDLEERRRAEAFESIEPPVGPIWPYALTLVLILAVGVSCFMYATAPKSADRLYQTIDAAKQSGVDHLGQVEDELRQFVERFADDPRAEEVGEYLSYIEVSRFPRRLEQRVRFRGGASLSTAERDLLDALRVEDTDPQLALHKLRTLIAVYGPLTADAPTRSKCVQAAEQRLEQLTAAAAEYIARHRQVMMQGLVRADELLPVNVPAAQALLRGMIERHAHQPWAADEILKAKRKLAQIIDLTSQSSQADGSPDPEP